MRSQTQSLLTNHRALAMVRKTTPLYAVYPIKVNGRNPPQNPATFLDMSNNIRGPAAETPGQSDRRGCIINLRSQHRKTLGFFSSLARASWSDWNN